MNYLLLIWSFLVLLLLTAGILLVVFSCIWRDSNDVLIRWIVDWVNEETTIALGSLYIAATVLAVIGIMRPKWEPIWLKVLNGYLLFLAIFTLVIASSIWLLSLGELANFESMWAEAPLGVQARLQDKFECCGYRNATTAGGLNALQGFCADLGTAMLQPGCMLLVTSAVDTTINHAFSTVYGFEAILVCLFLATACIVNVNAVAVRFKRIDNKRGGGGFV